MAAPNAGFKLCAAGGACGNNGAVQDALAEMAEPLMTLEGVAAGHGRDPVLRDVNLSVRRGSFTGLLGANGSGKTTLLKTVLGIIPPLAGRVVLHPVAGREPVAGYVPQRETLDPLFLLSCFEVVLMGTYRRVGPMRRVGRDEKEWAGHCLDTAGVAKLAGRRFAELSGGQKQRVLIARALATKPHLLLLDEPTAGLDATAVQAIMEVLGRVHREGGVTVVMVNHDLATTRKFAQEVVWLRQGRAVQGPVATLLSRDKIEEMLDLELS